MASIDHHTDQDGIVTITMDMAGPVNVMNDTFLAGMDEALARVESDPTATGMVLASGKETFFAGGDIKGMSAQEGGDYNAALTEGVFRAARLLRRIERLKVPTAAAINGAALGGSYELALVCNHRVALDDPRVRIGLPEATLGLLPGGGGTVRLTKLLGLARALPILLEGRSFSATGALEAGLIDAVATDRAGLIEQAKTWLRAKRSDPLASIQPWDRPDYRIPGGDLSNPEVANLVFMTAFKLFEETRGLYPNKRLILDVATEAAKLSLDAALRVESRALVNLIVSPVGKNIMSANFLQLNEVRRGRSRPKAPARTLARRVGVIGAGMMGQGIAYAVAAAGIETVLVDVSLEKARQIETYAEKAFARARARGAGGAPLGEVLARISPTADPGALAGSDVIVEAVFEQLELKQEIAARAFDLLAPGGIWGSNTSTLPIARLAEPCADPSRFLGLHFFSPVDRMDLVEIVCPQGVGEEALARGFDFVRQIGKTPIVVSDKAGFFTSRTITRQVMEGVQLLAEGVHPVRIDSLARAIGLPVGPLTLQDEVSQRLTLEALNTQRDMGLDVHGDTRAPLADALLRDMVERGRGGRRFGGGYYDYDGGGKKIWPPLLERYYRASLEIPDEDIKDRLLFAAVIESLRCLEEGVLRSVAEGNIGSILGIGAPKWTGGYLQFVNTFGLERFVRRCEELARSYGRRFAPPQIARTTLSAGGVFA
ncbi:MAG: enoyl-CoA hydratase/isomerase family protein [Alphaproteobacteria bacterium]|nr:enoyl-CoA hydratase/isomerase family protein [Alphaproteobacteria bacterium]